MKHFPHATALGTAATLVFFAPCAAFASGIELRETDATSVASAYVGGVSRATDASTVLLNPAGMSLLEYSEIEGNAFYIGPSAQFSGQNYLAPNVRTTGTNGNKDVSPSATGSGYGVWKISDRWAVGYAATTPWGIRMNYPENWTGRYQSLVTSITGYELDLAVSWKVTSRLSIGVGPRFGFLQGRFTETANLGALNAYGPTNASLAGNGFGFGYSAGAIYRVDDDTQIGVTYRSRMSFPIATKLKFAPPLSLEAAQPQVNGLLAAESGHSKMQVTLPDSVSFGFTRKLSKRWTLMMQGEWTHWSLLQGLNAVSDHNGLDTSIPVGWHNSWFGGVSAAYRVLPNVTLHSGFSYDQSPSDAESRFSRAPDSSRYTIGFGAEYSPIRQLTMELSFAHLFFASAPINSSSSATAGQLVGEYSNHANVVGFGVRTHF
ncbi:OmpP1/FadL family transporter [Acetobacter oeni]|uniref:Aromatic hydrocarbon degradation protein n=1 Tax=Acetobacter oeni TaxID=304077 RepID=A0A511XLP6_9PROT|nr:outer membrane protein transport protein [Acetobacter oeni]MBB3884315.1 long-chain fatty acid transport protein [Acetobacter oeni]NHO20239.1 hypothetical protein [Acetobacter oeni]GBR07620.1 aromatic hydrocarbon degradation membrane protein [Acetobacter oeni LMG 21952]GEN63869.1 aromatic hydrocarbon degradation protein [Acetobacter oeni]